MVMELGYRIPISLKNSKFGNVIYSAVVLEAALIDALSSGSTYVAVDSNYTLNKRTGVHERQRLLEVMVASEEPIRACSYSKTALS